MGSWKGSETIAAAILEELGFKVVETHRQVRIDGVDVSDVDIVAERDGVLYAVEVKAGAADVNAVRQAYVNAQLLGMKPMVIARGADERAIKVAERLGVELLTLPNLLIAGPDELKEIVEEAVWDAIMAVAMIPYKCSQLSSEDLEVLQAVASTETIKDAAERLGVDMSRVARVLDKVRKLGLAPRPKKYSVMKALASLVIMLCSRSGGSFGSS